LCLASATLAVIIACHNKSEPLHKQEWGADCSR